jgi:hypothetical protein
MVVQQLVGTIEVCASPRPAWLAEPRPAGLLVGLVHHVASPTGVSWNSLLGGFRHLQALRDTLGAAL